MRAYTRLYMIVFLHNAWNMHGQQILTKTTHPLFINAVTMFESTKKNNDKMVVLIIYHILTTLSVGIIVFYVFSCKDWFHQFKIISNVSFSERGSYISIYVVFNWIRYQVHPIYNVRLSTIYYYLFFYTCLNGMCRSKKELFFIGPSYVFHYVLFTFMI